MKIRNIITCLPAAILLLATCSSPESAVHEFRTFEEEGIPVALTEGGPKYTQPLFTYEELYRLEQDESREETVLGGVGSPTMDEAGNIYVGDSRNYRIAVYDGTGRYLRSMGRQGSGPGEFQMIRLLGVWDDQVIACDIQQMRIAVFTTAGNFVRSIRFPRVTMKQPLFFNTMGAYPAPDERIVLVQQAFAPVGDGTGSAFRAGVHSEEDEELAEVISPPAPAPGVFQGAPMLFYAPGRGILHARCPEPELEVYDLDGSLQRIIRLDVPRDPVTAAERERVVSQLHAEIENAAEQWERERAQRELDELTFPAEHDLWFGIRVDDAGFIWASEPPGSFANPYHERKWRILSPEGEYLGDTWFPAVTGRSASGAPSRGHLIMEWEDEETGAPVVAVFRISPAVRGFSYP